MPPPGPTPRDQKIPELYDFSASFRTVFLNVWSPSQTQQDLLGFLLKMLERPSKPTKWESGMMLTICILHVLGESENRREP